MVRLAQLRADDLPLALRGAACSYLVAAVGAAALSLFNPAPGGHTAAGSAQSESAAVHTAADGTEVNVGAELLPAHSRGD